MRIHDAYGFSDDEQGRIMEGNYLRLKESRRAELVKLNKALSEAETKAYEMEQAYLKRAATFNRLYRQDWRVFA